MPRCVFWPPGIGKTGDWIPKAAICIVDKALGLLHSVRLCVETLERVTWLVRLKIWEREFRAPGFDSAPPGCTGWQWQVSAGQEIE